jgi:hypothetical protein
MKRVSKTGAHSGVRWSRAKTLEEQAHDVVVVGAGVGDLGGDVDGMGDQRLAAGAAGQVEGAVAAHGGQPGPQRLAVEARPHGLVGEQAEEDLVDHGLAVGDAQQRPDGRLDHVVVAAVALLDDGPIAPTEGLQPGAVFGPFRGPAHGGEGEGSIGLT